MTTPLGRPGSARVVASVAAAVVALALIAAGCGGAGGAHSTASPTAAPVSPVTVPTSSPGCAAGTDPAAARSGPTDLTLTSGGTERHFQRHIPSGYDGRPAPLVIDLHGYLSGAAVQAQLSNLGTAADQHGFVLVTPQGSSAMPYWNAVPHPGLPDDVQFVTDLIDTTSAQLCIDPARVYVDGLSNGAFLTSLIACRLADRVAAVAAVAGLLLPADCAPARPIPVLAFHGTADRFVTFDGSPNVALDTLTWNDDSRAAFAGLPFAPVTETAGQWAALDGCDPIPTSAPVSPSVTRVAYGGCAGGASVELYVVAGGGHTWPGSAFTRANAAVLGPTTDEVDADTVIWAFFAAHPLAP